MMPHDDLIFALSVTHCPWIPARAASMQQLRATLGVQGGDPAQDVVGFAYYHEEDQRAPWWSWSESMWRWGAEQQASHVVFLQDDAVASPVFWPALRAMVAARPKDVISLHCLHLAAMTLARQGVRWASTADGLVGLGYVFPVHALRAFLAWRPAHLRPGGAQELAEDSHINVWAVCTDRRILHPIPTIVDHAPNIASTNPGQTAARPRVVWTDGETCGWTDADLVRPDFWTGRAQHLGRQYAKTHWAAKMVVPSFDRFFDVESDECPPEYARFFHHA
jgi:hypothetical protein